MEISYRYVISDIHGCCKTFRFLIKDKIKLTKSDKLYLLGDYIDRGPDSKGVLDFIIELQLKGFTVVPLKGNHEDMMLKSAYSYNDFALWMINGGAYTLKSFGIDTAQTFKFDYIYEIPEKYLYFIRWMRYVLYLKDYFLVHAGFDFSKPNPFQDKKSMLWIRDFRVDKKYLDNKKIIHGHTPVSINKIIENVKNTDSYIINIDGGCVYKNIEGFGHLTALNLDTNELYIARNID